MSFVCRYGQAWAAWRLVGWSNGEEGRTERLALEEREEITTLTGQSANSDGWTICLDATTSTGSRWQKGLQEEYGDFSKRPSPTLARGRLSHLSGSKTGMARVLCCHWASG